MGALHKEGKKMACEHGNRKGNIKRERVMGGGEKISRDISS